MVTDQGYEDAYEQKRIKGLDYIEGKLKLTRWSMFFIVSLAALLTIFYVYNTMSVDSLMKDIRVLERQQKSLQIRNKKLIIKSSSLQSPERISRIAETRLGMQAPDRKPEIIP